jgi:hypothetical protein
MRRIRKFRSSAGFSSLLTVLPLLAGLCVPVSLWAGGRQINSQTADGIEIWQKEFDVSSLKPGRYNFIVTAKDAAGNAGTSGPFNIQVDPKAGLPIARVVYPESGMVIRSELNIIGVASGRYGVKQVLARLDDAEYTPVAGIEYWSRIIDIKSLAEGRHTIFAKAVDSKDLEGPEFSVTFIVDRGPPAIELISHKTGDLVSGNQTLTGTADDPNGIALLGWSADGTTWNNLPFKTKKGQTLVNYSFPLRTRTLEDGPAVYYIRAVDKTGYAITKPYLFFINNHPPVVEILSPERTEDVFGETQVTGRVIAEVGLSQFTYEWAGQTADIPLRPGDPFWAVTLPVSLGANRSTPFRVTAVDKSGNVTIVTQRFQDSRRLKAPTLVIDYPTGSALNSIPQDGSIYGHVAPGFFPAAISIEGQIEFIDAKPSFRISPDMIPQGRSSFKIWAIAEDDTMGAPVTVRVNKPPLTAPRGQPLPEVNLNPSIISITGPEPYSWFNNSVVVTGSVGSGGSRLEYRLHPTADWLPITVSADRSFSANIGLSHLEEGPVHLELRTFTGDLPNIPVYHPVNKFSSGPQITFLTPSESFGSIHGMITVSGTVTGLVPLAELTYSLDGAEYAELPYISKYGKSAFSYTCDFTSLNKMGKRLTIRAKDQAGSVIEQSPVITFDDTDDIPVIILNTPLENEVITSDFSISGIAFDDDGVNAVNWRILTPENPWDTVEVTAEKKKDVEFQTISTAQSFETPIGFGDVTDGENIIEYFAEDIYGVRGKPERRIIRVSSAAPETEVKGPPIDVYNRRNIVMFGTAADLNGIKEVLISMDNGNSYQKADMTIPPDPSQNPQGLAEWKLNLNTRAYQDGVYSVLIRAIDNYGIEAFSNALINIDNTPPEISLGAPVNGASAGLSLAVTGQAHDNISLKSLSLQLVNINDGQQQIAYDMPAEFVIMENVDISALSDGKYNLKITAVDMAGNETAVTRDITISKDKTASAVNIYNPMPGIDHSGPLHISGTVTGAVIPKQVNLMLNQQRFAVVDVDRYGVFRYDFPEERITKSEVFALSAVYDAPAGGQISSYDHDIKVSPWGPVLEVDSHKDGDVITKRPWISGRAFIAMGEEEQAALTRRQKSEMALKRVEISFDNGRTFEATRRSGQNWRYRLETGDLAAGPLPVLLKAEFADGQVAVRRIILTVDTSPPNVITVGPTENSTHRDSVLVYGSSDDDFDMDSVEVSLRPGDKAGYEVPQFIQGLYFDTSVLGGTTFTVGLGLSFFENNVKLQFQYGQAEGGGRYSGNVFGAKLIANVFYLPFDYLFGPDWAFFSMSLGLGANFSWFTMEAGEIPLMMSGVIAQWEFMRADLGYFFPNWKYFKTVSFYIEPILWFAPSDVTSDEAARAIFRFSLGARLSLF